MEKILLKQTLLNFYSNAMTDMIIRGDRKPSYENICKLNETYNIPFTAWKDIKSFITDNSISNHSTKSSSQK